MSVRVDSHADPFHELRRVLHLQLARNYAAFRNYLVEHGQIAEAQVGRARKPCTENQQWAANHLHLGFLAYLAGRGAIARCRRLLLRGSCQLNFKQAWDCGLKNPDFAVYGRSSPTRRCFHTCAQLTAALLRPCAG